MGFHGGERGAGRCGGGTLEGEAGGGHYGGQEHCVAASYNGCIVGLLGQTTCLYGDGISTSLYCLFDSSLIALALQE